MSATDWVCIDFGSAYIRVVRATAANDPASVNPLPIQFNGRPELLNLAYLTPNKAGLKTVGKGVLRLDPVALDLRLLRVGATLAAGAETEDGHTARLLLDHIAALLEREHGWRRDDPDTTVLVAAPIISRPGAEPVSRLREAGWPVGEPPADAGIDSALAALAHATAGRPDPGRYGIVDLGAAHTRFAVVDCRPDALPTVVARNQMALGGGEFDSVLLAHFGPLLPPLPDEGDDLRQWAIESFKRSFSEAWANGQTRHVAVHDIGGQRVTLSLDQDGFNQVAAEQIAEFCAAANVFFRQHAPDGDLARLILVGGGAHWPFVYEWAAGYVGAGNVWRDTFPEQAVARGLPRLAAMRQMPVDVPQPKRGGAGNGISPSRPRPERPDTHSGLSAGPAAMLEFFGGLFGFLGLGWFFGTRRLGLGCPLLLGWWLALILLFTLGVASAISDQPVLLVPLLLLWLGIPALSAFLLHRRLKNVPSP